MEEVFYYIGQALGFVVVILGFINFQMRSSKGIIALQFAIGVVFVLHYLFLGAMTGVALNAVATFATVLYYFRAKRKSNSIVEPCIYIALMIVASILTWGGAGTFLLLGGLIILAIALALPNPQSTRVLIIVKFPLCFGYNLLTMSFGGMAYESMTLISSIIGLIRNRKKPTDENSECVSKATE